MLDIIKAEFKKGKRTSINKFIVITPLIALISSFLWGGGQNGAYNWWYVMFIPGMLAIISSQVITREKDLSYKGVLLYPSDKGLIWLGKIAYVGILFILSNLIFIIGIRIIEFIGVGFLNELPIIPLKANIIGGVVLILTFLFQIPISLFLTIEFNIFVTVLFNLGMTIFGVIIYDTNSILKFLPYRIPSTLMVPILRILPNGLPVKEDSILLSRASILGYIIINISTFLILTILTTIWFRRKEVI